MSTTVMGPQSASMSSLLLSTYLPPTIRPARDRGFSFSPSDSVASGSECSLLHALLALDGTAVEFRLEGTAVEFRLEGPYVEFALEFAKKLVGLEAEGEPRGDPGLEDGAENEGR